MIRFSLRCSNDHAFESWFQSGQAFEDLLNRKLVSCPICGDAVVEKTLMAPAIASASKELPAQAPPPKSPEVEARLKALRSHVEANSDYVGERFATEARAMYLGEIPDRPIFGEAKLAEAKALIEDGVPVLPLPFTPSRKSN